MTPGFYINDEGEVFLTHLNKKIDLMSQQKSELRLSGWVASEHCNFFTNHPPIRKKAVLLKTLPYMLEEHLIEAVENYHFTFITRRRDEPVYSCVTTHERMKNWQEMFSIAAIKPRALYPDIYALPYKENTIGAYISKERCLARTGYYSGFCGRGDVFHSLLNKKLQQTDAVIITDDRESVPEDLQDKVIEEVQDWLSYLSRQIVPDISASLLHGKYGVERKGASSSLYRSIGWAALFLFAIVSAQQFIFIETQRQEINKQKEKNALLYEQMFNQPLETSADLRNSVLTAMEQLAQKQAGDRDPTWELVVSLSEFLNQCNPCVLQRFKLEGKKVEMDIRARNKEPVSREQLREKGWRMQSWRTEEKEVPEGGQPVFETRLVMTNR